MHSDDKSGKTILVFGATGQQGGSVAEALLAGGWPVCALVRDPASARARALRDRGAVLARGDLVDRDSLRAAMAGAYGVFSVQPSSGQGAAYGVSDADEVRYGVAVADLASELGVRHLVYSSTNAAGDEPSGMGHLDSKSRVERHIRTLPIPFTVVRPATFMEMLAMPGFGLPDGRFTFFPRPDQPVQLIAVRDIGRIVAGIFADPARYAGRTFEIAGDTVTGTELAARLGAVAGRAIAYQRFPDAVLAASPFLAGLTRLVDDGRLAGRADLAELRAMNPDLLSFARWLDRDGRPLIRSALDARGAWDYGPA